MRYGVTVSTHRWWQSTKGVSGRKKDEVQHFLQLARKRLTISETAPDWHELVIQQRTMRPSIARVGEQLDTRFLGKRTYHRPNHPH